MSVVLGTLCLNEIEWLPRLYEQHKKWPTLKKWVFVESADKVYADTNPDMVNELGLSVDGTSEYLKKLASIDPRVVYIPYGIAEHPTDPAQNKCKARQCYLDIANEIAPESVVVVDADEFYPKRYQQSIIDLMRREPQYTGYAFKHREIWRPPCLYSPLFTYEVVGGFWDVLYCRVWRWQPGLKYTTDHNTPETKEGKLTAKLRRPQRGDPDFVHMGFASQAKNRKAKHDYYVARGEGRTDHRQPYVDSRAAYLTWHPTDNPILPGRARVIPYTGLVPEVFQDESNR